MGLLDVTNHLVNFAAPAFFLALAMPLFARLTARDKAARLAFVVQSAVTFVAGLGVLLAGLWIWGQDGKMLTYLALVLVCGTTQWAMQRS